GLLHRSRARNGEVDEDSACEIERREKIKIPGEPQMIGKRRRHQAADEIARNIAGDVGGEGAGGGGSAAVLSQIGELQGKGGGHARARRDTKQRKRGKVGGDSKERSRQRQQGEPHQYAGSPLDVSAEYRDD